MRGRGEKIRKYANRKISHRISQRAIFWSLGAIRPMIYMHVSSKEVGRVGWDSGMGQWDKAVGQCSGIVQWDTETFKHLLAFSNYKLILLINRNNFIRKWAQRSRIDTLQWDAVVGYCSGIVQWDTAVWYFQWDTEQTETYLLLVVVTMR